MGKIRILLADDHGVVRAGIRMLINAQPDMEVVGEASDGKGAIAQAETLHPDVVILDLAMPNLGGLSALGIIKQRVPEVRILILTMHDDERYLDQALSAGASGYVVKKAADMELLSAVRAVMRGEVYVHSSLTRFLIERRPDRGVERRNAGSEAQEGLTGRQREVLILLAQGYTNRQIADRLFLSVKTIETYRSRLMQQLDLRNRAELFQYAVRKGLLPRDE